LKYYILIKKVSDRIGQHCSSAISFSVIIRQNRKILKDWLYYPTKPFRTVEPFFLPVSGISIRGPIPLPGHLPDSEFIGAMQAS
jgi:hypothetical protein